MDSMLPITFVDFYQVRYYYRLMKTTVHALNCIRSPLSNDLNFLSIPHSVILVVFPVNFTEYWRGCGGGLGHPPHPHSCCSSDSYLLVLEAFLP